MAHHIPPTRGSGADAPLGPDAATPRNDGRGRAPFAWQHGSQLLLLEARPLGWVLAELRFDRAACHYVEVRRARYRWPREAACALLGRALVGGEAVAAGAARDLQVWLAAEAGGRTAESGE